MPTLAVGQAKATGQSTANTSYTTVCTLDASELDGGTRYLIMAKASVGASSTSAPVYIRLAYGATPTEFTGSEAVFEGSWFTPWGFIADYTHTTGDDIVVQIHKTASGPSAQADGITITYLCLDNLTENTDFWFDENTSTEAHTTGFTTRSSVTVNPPSTQDYLFLAHTQIQIDTLLTQPQSRIKMETGTAEYGPWWGYEGRDASEVQGGWSGMIFNLTTGNKTMLIETRDRSGTAANDHLRSLVFALRLNALDEYSSAHTNDSDGVAETWVEAAGVTHTPTQDGEVLIVATGNLDVNDSAETGRVRLQIDGSDEPTSHYDNEFAINDDADSLPAASVAVVDGTDSVGIDIDYDNYFSDDTSNQSHRYATIFAMSMGPAPAAGQPFAKRLAGVPGMGRAHNHSKGIW